MDVDPVESESDDEFGLKEEVDGGYNQLQRGGDDEDSAPVRACACVGVWHLAG